MEISIPKTKVQHIQKRPRVSETTEDDVNNLPEGKKFEFRCEACDMTYTASLFTKDDGAKEVRRQRNLAAKER